MNLSFFQQLLDLQEIIQRWQALYIPVLLSICLASFFFQVLSYELRLILFFCILLSSIFYLWADLLKKASHKLCKFSSWDIFFLKDEESYRFYSIPMNKKVLNFFLSIFHKLDNSILYFFSCPNVHKKQSSILLFVFYKAIQKKVHHKLYIFLKAFRSPL